MERLVTYLCARDRQRSIWLGDESGIRAEAEARPAVFEYRFGRRNRHHEIRRTTRTARASQIRRDSARTLRAEADVGAGDWRWWWTRHPDVARIRPSAGYRRRNQSGYSRCPHQSIHRLRGKVAAEPIGDASQR